MNYKMTLVTQTFYMCANNFNQTNNIFMKGSSNPFKSAYIQETDINAIWVLKQNHMETSHMAPSIAQLRIWNNVNNIRFPIHRISDLSNAVVSFWPKFVNETFQDECLANSYFLRNVFKFRRVTTPK